MGDGRAEGSSATGDRGQAAVLLMPDVDGTHILIFESSQTKGYMSGDYYSWTLKALSLSCRMQAGW